MLLQVGQWLGKGSLLVEGQSLGQGISCEVEVSHEDVEFAIAAEIDIKELGGRALSIRVVANEEGTYAVEVRTMAGSYSGVAKLDSAPNLGLLWNEEGTTFLTFTLFAIQEGCGFRGFLREGSSTYTWEVAFSLKHEVVVGDNVVSLANRRRR
jgi:hypothetical protein